MNVLKALIRRNVKLFFKDKALFISSLITPLILLVLYVTFLGKVYRDAFSSSMPEGVVLPERLLGGAVGGQLFSSLLAVCCVTVAFCSNFLIVQDKVSGAKKDFIMSPVRNSFLALGYFISAAFAALIICITASAACLIYIGVTGWYISAADMFFIFIDILLLTLFGTALSSVINFFLTTEGQITAVGTAVSAGYGFVCGAYMPLSQFGKPLQTVVGFLPGTYGTALLRNHAMKGVFSEMLAQGIPADAVDAIRNTVDCNLYFFGNKVPVSAMYAVLTFSAAALTAVYVLLNRYIKQKN